MLSTQFLPSLSTLTHFPTLHVRPHHAPLLPPIRMGGGPRTFPGGVTKWEWKRMQAKKSKQLLKARLLRERQIYEMRKRAELKASISQLEKPWELVEKAPVLFSVKADEQVKALADRFQKPGGFDMWSDRDGPQVFDSNVSLSSQRFFPKGVVHSVKPYESNDNDGDGIGNVGYDDWIARGGGGVRRRRHKDGVRLNAKEKEGCIEVEGSVVRENVNTLISDGNENNARDLKGKSWPRQGDRGYRSDSEGIDRGMSTYRNSRGSENGRMSTENSMDFKSRTGFSRRDPQNSYSSDSEGNRRRMSTSVNDRRKRSTGVNDRGREMSHSSFENPKVLKGRNGMREGDRETSDSEGITKSDYTSRQGLTLRPTSDFNSIKGNNCVGNSTKRNDNGFRRNRGGSSG